MFSLSYYTKKSNLNLSVSEKTEDLIRKADTSDLEYIKYFTSYFKNLFDKNPLYIEILLCKCIKNKNYDTFEYLVSL